MWKKILWQTVLMMVVMALTYPLLEAWIGVEVPFITKDCNFIGLWIGMIISMRRTSKRDWTFSKQYKRRVCAIAVVWMVPMLLFTKWLLNDAGSAFLPWALPTFVALVLALLIPLGVLYYFEQARHKNE